MSIEDRIAITDNIYAYSYHWDSQDVDRFLTVFTEDALWEFFASGAKQPEVSLHTHAQIRAWASDRLARRKGKFVSRHFQTNIVFDDLRAGSARTRTMVLVTHQSVDERAPKPILSGVYHDEHVKTADGWKMRHRAVHHDLQDAHVSTT